MFEHFNLDKHFPGENNWAGCNWDGGGARHEDGRGLRGHFAQTVIHPYMNKTNEKEILTDLPTNLQTDRS